MVIFAKIGLGINLIDKAPKAVKRILMLRSWLKPRYIIVIGPVGAGKSRLIEKLKAGLDVIDSKKDSPSTDPGGNLTEIYWKGFRIKVFDLNGQEINREHQIKKIQKSWGTKKIGIINVVAGGYLETRSSKTKLNTQLQRLMIEQGIEEATIYGRKREVQYLQQMQKSRVFKNTKIAWVITVINKADLWGNENFYQTDGHEYRKLLLHALSLNRNYSSAYFSKFCCETKKFYLREGNISILSDEERKKLIRDFEQTLFRRLKTLS